MPDTFPEDCPAEGWPAKHAVRLDALEADRKNLPRLLFAATLLGTALPSYLRPDVLAQAHQLALDHPGAGVAVALVVLVAGAKIPPPAEDSRLMPLWQLWAKYVAQTPWDRWLGPLKSFGEIVPAIPPRSTPRSTDEAGP